VKRYPVMYNDFVLIGPTSDLATKGKTDIVEALKAIKAKATPFISRGDRSGTNIAELDLWKAAGIEIAKEKGPWYKEIGQGMGAALIPRRRRTPRRSPTAASGFRSRTAGTL
jgi:tungstate transport system substrate-binding protein